MNLEIQFDQKCPCGHGTIVSLIDDDKGLDAKFQCADCDKIYSISDVYQPSFF